jgi:hypothetical protein
MSSLFLFILFDRYPAADAMQLHIDILEELTLGSVEIRRHEVG